MLYHLGRLPHIQEKLQQEVDRVVGKEKHITPDKIAKLSYLKACLKESMRYYTYLFLFCFVLFFVCLFFNIHAMYTLSVPRNLAFLQSELSTFNSDRQSRTIGKIRVLLTGS